MALADAGLFLYPDLRFLAGGTATTFAYDAAGDVLGTVFKVPKTGTIANVHFRIATVASPVATHRIELRTVSATNGQPSAAGTLYGSSTSIGKDASLYSAGSNQTAAVNATGATKGDICAVVFDLSAATSGSFTMADRLGEYVTGLNASGFPYGARNATGAMTLDALPMQAFCLEYSGGVFVPVIPGFQWVGSTNSASVTNSGTTRRGNKIRPPMKARATGIYVEGDIDGAVLLRLRLASDDSILATITLDPDQRARNARDLHHHDFATAVELTAGTDYYVTFEGNDATGGTIYFLENAPSNAALDILPGGKNCFGVTYAGSYTEANTTRYNIGLILDQLDDGAGGGTTIAGTPMRRGMV